MPQISSVLPDLNPWWKAPFEADYRERTIYPWIKKFLPERQIISLTGLRRVGKTTLLKKIAADAIAEGLDPKDLVYFSFDEFKGIEIRDILRTYEELLGRNVTDRRILLLLDEVQKLEDWENQAKALYDLYPQMKILISGSESLFIKRRARATLAGRLYEFQIEPLRFEEYLGFKGVPWNPPGLYSRELKRTYEEYLSTQGFPELVGVQDRKILRKYVKESIVDKVLYRDITLLFPIKQISVLETLLDLLMDEPGQLIDLTSLGRDLAISRQTLSLYLRYLEDSFLIRKLFNYSRNKRKTGRKLRKIYPTICSPDLFFGDDRSRSRAFECAVVNQLNAEYFWRDPYKNEVDVVLAGDSPIPIEIKSGKIEMAGLLFFMKKHRLKEGTAISRDIERIHDEDGRRIQIVPAYKYFLPREADEVGEGRR